MVSSSSYFFFFFVFVFALLLSDPHDVVPVVFIIDTTTGAAKDKMEGVAALHVVDRVLALLPSE